LTTASFGFLSVKTGENVNVEALQMEIGRED